MVELKLAILNPDIQRLQFSVEGFSIELLKGGVHKVSDEEFEKLLKNEGFKLCIDDKSIMFSKEEIIESKEENKEENPPVKTEKKTSTKSE